MKLMSLLAKPKVQAGEEPAREQPAYYEVWGSLESANRALWMAVWVSMTMAVLAMISLRIVLTRPPVVIRVDGEGAAQVIADPGQQPAVSKAEIRNFLSLFERFFTQLNFYTYDSDLRLAFSMMTGDYQTKANDLLKRTGIIENLKANQSKTTLTVTEIKILKDTPQLFECQVKGYRQIGSYKPDVPSSEVVFEDDVILKKVPRGAQTPYGVLVEDWNESLFKDH